MADDNVIEIDFDEEEKAEVLDTSAVNIPQQAGVPNSMTVGVLGTNSIAKSINIMFACSNSRNVVNVVEYTDIDEMTSDQTNAIAFVCLDAKLVKDDLFDDAEIVDACSKIAKHTRASVVLKTTVPYTTIEKILAIVNPDRFVYAPEVASEDNLDEILRSDIAFVGGTAKSSPAYLRLLNGGSVFERRIVAGTTIDIALAKAAAVGLKAVTQTYWNQIYDYVQESQVGNYNTVKKAVGTIKEDVLNSIPTFVRAKAEEGVSYKKAKSFAGEFANTDVKILASMTDKLTLLDECINIKNLKD